MDHSKPIDPGRAIDWGKTSEDYGRHRPGPPRSFYERLKALGIGLPGQRILDLGTGTGLLARQFARQGSIVSGCDISDGQIETAKRLADEAKLTIDFRVGPAEEVPFDGPFDAITANQCWLYFDKPLASVEVARLLKPKTGLFCTSHFSWLARQDTIAAETEKLVLKYNPQWTANDWSGVIPVVPSWTKDVAPTVPFNLRAMFYYDEPIPFTHESWRGRIRACRGTGATLSGEELAKFDAELAQMLAANVGPEFDVLHRLDAHIFDLNDPAAYTL